MLDGYRCFGFPALVWKQGGIGGTTYFSQTALWANIAVAAFCSTLAALLRIRAFSWRSIVVIVALAMAAIYLNFRFRGQWFEGGYGFPLLWYKQADVDLPDTGFRFGGFVVDVLVIVIVFKAVAHFLKSEPHDSSVSPETPISHS
jgi:hypothetical protein